MAKTTIIDAHNLAQRNSGECLSTKFVSQQKGQLKWRCKYGHVWNALYITILRGSWCPDCSGARKYTNKYTIKDAIRVAEERRGKCLSKRYKSNKSNLKWKCRDGHVWSASFSSINNGGTWCPKCAQNFKLTIKDAKEAAKTRNGKCLSMAYINDSTKMKWECKRGHKWFARFHDIRGGHWCPQCSNTKKLTLACAKKIANKAGGRCLSKRYCNSRAKMKWECRDGHVWFATLNNIKYNKSWCPKCKRINSKQNKLYKILCDIFPDKNVVQNYRGFDWLKTYKNGKQEIDIFISDDTGFSLAIEYQGEQHYFPVRFGGISEEKAEKNFVYVRKLDKIKRDKILAHKKDIKYFVEFAYKDQITRNNVIRRLKKHGVNSGSL